MPELGQQFNGMKPYRGGSHERELKRVAERLAPQGSADRLWEMADYHALKGNGNEEAEYRAAAKLREQS